MPGRSIGSILIGSTLTVSSTGLMSQATCSAAHMPVVVAAMWTVGAV